ncbi:MAG: DegT/DnrJ/EryC1/StrS family aminotransferase [Candidatus Ratteibacteria bacterium]
MKLSFSTLACPEWELKKIIEKSKKFGYDGIEIRGILKELDLAKVPELNEEAENTKKLLSSNNIEISCISASSTFTNPDPSEREKNIQMAVSHIDIAKRFNIVVLEDAAHAFGAEYNGKKIGTIGHFGAFSFHEVKNITSLGEGGILVTNEEIGKDFPKARFVGFDISNPIPLWLYDVVALKWKGDYFAPGNHSVTEIQAVALLSQMKRLNKIIEKRRKAAEYLNEKFKDIKGIVIPPLDDNKIKSTHHLYLFQVESSLLKGDIQDVKKKMAEKGITQIPHFAPLYRFSIMKQLGYDTEKIKQTCPNAEEVFLHRFTHLPLYDFKKQDLKYMADSIIEIIKGMQK